MERFPDKLREARMLAQMSQTTLASLVQVSRRSIFSYESGEAIPRKRVLAKIAEALNVTVEYLTNDEIDDPESGFARENSIKAAKAQFGAKGAKEVERLLDQNLAFLAGGDVPQEDKDAFFDVLMSAYVAAKERARAKYTAKSSGIIEE